MTTIRVARHLLLAVALAIGLLCAIPPAHAAIKPGETELLVFGGSQFDGAQFSVFGLQLLPKPGLEETSFVTGVILGHNVSRRIGLEADFGYAPRMGEPFEASIVTTMANVVLHLTPDSNGILYVSLGGGVVWFDSADRGVPNDLALAIAAAIGVKAYVGDRWLVRVDFRYYYAPSDFTDQNMIRRTILGAGIRF